jgi:hypothetical protein
MSRSFCKGGFRAAAELRLGVASDGTWSATVHEPTRVFGLPAELSRSAADTLAFLQEKNPMPVVQRPHFELNGKWLAMGVGFIVIQVKDGVISAEGATDSLKPTGQAFIRGHFDPDVMTGTVEIAEYTGGFMITAPTWHATTLKIVDPDQMLLGTTKLIRQPFPDNFPCEYHNPFHVKIDYALIRGEAVRKRQELKNAACWFYVSAVQGDARA